MYKFTYYVLGLLLCSSLLYCQNQAAHQVQLNTSSIANNHETFESYHNIKILTNGPTGSKFTNSKRGEFGLLIYMIQIFNDSIVPIDLEVKFPSKPVPLLPDSMTKVEVYMLPDSITPDTIQNAANWGVIGIEDFFNSDLTDPGILKTRIQPKEHHTFYLGMLSESERKMGSGTTIAKLFLNGQAIDAPLSPVALWLSELDKLSRTSYNTTNDMSSIKDQITSALKREQIKTEKTGSSSLGLIFGVGNAPNNQHILIPCGQINFLK